MQKLNFLYLFLLFSFLISCMNASEKGFDKDTVMPAGYQKNDATAACPAINPSGTILLGVYYGNQGWAMSDVTAMENWQCKKTR